MGNIFVNNIFLIGMMGSGKTVTGKSLAEKLGLQFVDLDSEIESAEGCSISDIFAGRGEPEFRKIEKKALRNALKKEGQVVSTGGGIILDPDNVSRMQESGKVIYLETSLSQLWERLQDSKGRPLLEKENPREILAAIYRDREYLYLQSAHLTVVTDGLSAEEAAVKVMQKLEGGE